ncbi:histidine kinase dimerization/phospho-acceptor domain-containing protein [Pseudomonas viridiflava]|uniref:histidine kinase dimerization/phospho-acceptor domain-containing protein n=1 Tax=Pseudomonas viridiflava TaxID=33069 RepID=UPI000AB0B4EB|nr:histidine kinase dimerization/phospho-acceptor domain-containing protein [Pseudomonas viridiflava]
MGESVELGRLREQFVAVLSHDLRTPLSAVRLSAEALHGDVSENRPEYWLTPSERAL